MVKVSVLYPNSAEGRFDLQYYCETHMALVRTCLGAACKGISVDQGLASAAPGSAAPFVAIGHLRFDSLEAFEQSFGPHAATIMGDLPNFTDIQPLVQISQISLES